MQPEQPQVPGDSVPTHDPLDRLLDGQDSATVVDSTEANLDEVRDWERAIAATQIALVQETLAMPRQLRLRILQQIDPTLSHEEEIVPMTQIVPSTETLPSAAYQPNDTKPRYERWLAWLGWAIAASCLLMIGLREWSNRTPEEPLTPVTLRQRLVESGKALLLAVAEKQLGEEAIGDVIWDNEQQEGYLRLSNLPKLEDKQLQLWIFDKNRDSNYPIDGGVFDSRSGEVVIPIQAKLPVGEPTMFAITVEEPGGVVVSKRERVIWLAKVTQ